MSVDAPWCSITSTHASHSYLGSMPSYLRALYDPPSVRPEKFTYGTPVKGRSEPTSIGKVAWVVQCLHPGLSLEELTTRAWNNTVELFDLKLNRIN